MAMECKAALFGWCESALNRPDMTSAHITRVSESQA